jgi:hypothetical protein
MKNKSKQFYVVSPDGFSIEREKTHDTPKLAWASFKNWKDRFSRQGYYSTVRNGQRMQIPLGELKAYCIVKEINS